MTMARATSSRPQRTTYPGYGWNSLLIATTAVRLCARLLTVSAG